MVEIKIIKIKTRIWWSFFLFLMTSVFGLMVATLVVPDWVKLNSADNPMYYFKGNILKITEGLNNIFNPIDPHTLINVSGKPYVKLSCACNFLLETSQPNGQLNPSRDLYIAWKSLFENLYKAGAIFLAFELSALVCLLAVISTIILFEFRRFYFAFNFCAAGCSWVSHVIAILTWLSTVNFTFDLSCDSLFIDKDPPRICALDGPKIGVFVLLYLTVVLILYFPVVCLYKYRVKNSSSVSQIKGDTKNDKKNSYGFSTEETRRDKKDLSKDENKNISVSENKKNSVGDKPKGSIEKKKTKK